jgi:hypothetical protein
VLVQGCYNLNRTEQQPVSSTIQGAINRSRLYFSQLERTIMGTRQIKSATETVREPDFTDPSKDGSEDDDEILAESLARLSAELGADEQAKVKISRVDGKTRKRSWLFDTSPSEFSLEEIRDNYGGGEYEVKAYARGGIYTHKTIRIELPASSTAKHADGVPRSIGPQLDAGAQMANAVMQAITAMGDRMADALRAASEANKPPSLTEQMQQLKMLRDILAPSMQQAPVPVQQGMTFSEFANVLSTVKDLLPSEGGRSSLDALVEIGKPLVAQLGSLIGKSPMPENHQATQAPALAAPSQQSGPALMPDGMRTMVTTLLHCAKSNADPLSFVDPIIELAGEDQIYAFLSREDWFTIALQWVPDVANYQAWFTRLHDAILQELTEPDDASISSGSPTIAPANAPGSAPLN